MGKIGRNDPCECGSGKKYKNCCGAPKGTQVEMRTKDLKDFELSPGLAEELTKSLDSSYLDYIAAAVSGKSTKEAESRIAAIPEEKRYLTRVLDSLDTAFADFDSETLKLDLPHMRSRTPEEIKWYLGVRMTQLKLLLDAVEDYVDEQHPVRGGHA